MNVIQHTIHMITGFNMKHNLRSTSLNQLIDKELRFCHHNVCFKFQFCFLSKLLYSIQTQRHTRAEVSVKYIYMNHLQSSFLYHPALLFQVTHIQCNHRWRDMTGFCPNFLVHLSFSPTYCILVH